MRDDFPMATKEVLAKRVGYRCSNPRCRHLTSGPSDDPFKVINIGVAAHVTAASAAGPRFDKSLVSDQRRSAENGIWLCQSCSKLVDNNPNKYTVEVLRGWKAISERCAADELESRIKKEAMSDSEQVTFLRTIAYEIETRERSFEASWGVLTKYHDVPREMDEDEWGTAVDALSACFESIRLLHKVALLVQERIINSRILYILCFSEISEYLTNKLSFLIKWCGTGLDLAANYDSYDLVRITPTLMYLLNELNIVHEEQGADLNREGYKAIIERFEERTKDFFADPSRFDQVSDNCIDNWVVVNHQ